MKISVIIPTLNEEKTLRRCIRSVRQALSFPEIIVADGDSSDATLAIVEEQGAAVIHARRGRGPQCNAGAAVASGEVILFLHADTVLPEDAGRQIEKFFRHPGVQAATFQLVFDHRHWLLNTYSYFTRLDSVFTRFGDQGIVVRRSFFVAVGGFPDWSLFEDVHFLQKTRRLTKVYSLPSAVVSSARRFLHNGLLRQQIKNGWYLFQYLFGVSPERLALKYFNAGSSFRRSPEQDAREVLVAAESDCRVKSG